MRSARTPMARAAVFSSLLVALYASPLLLSTRRDAWEFILHWDDDENFVANALVHAPLTADSLRAMWTTGRINVYEPLSWMLKAAVCRLAGLDAWAVRVATLALHVAACAVLARASSTLLALLELLDSSVASDSGEGEGIDSEGSGSSKRPTARPTRHWSAACLVSAALFAVHPVHVQVVAWPSAQPYALAALFANLAVYAYLRPIHKAVLELRERGSQTQVHDSQRKRTSHRECRRRGRHLGALDVVAGRADTWSRTLLVTGLYAAAVLSKSAAIFLPAALVFIDLLLLLKAHGASRVSTSGGAGPIDLAPSQSPATPRRRILAAYTARKIPLVVIFAASMVITLRFNRQGADADADVLVLTSYERIVKALSAPSDVAKLLLWPAGLRPHYMQLERQYADVWSSENLLPVVALALAAWAALYQCRPSINAPQHALALAYLVLTLLPVSGLIQHGLVTRTADRYAYMGSVTLVPYGGAILEAWLFSESRSSVDEEEQGGGVFSRDHPELTTPAMPGRSVATTSVHPFAMHRWMPVAVVGATLLQISTQLLVTWRSEEALYTYEIRTDPFDWRELDTLASMYNARGVCASDWDACRQLWQRSYANAPTTSVKAELFRWRTRLVLDGSAVVPQACAAYRALAIEHPNQPLVLNNLAVCQSYDKELAEARETFALALAHARVDSSRAVIERNMAAFDEWSRRQDEASGGEASSELFAAEIMY